MKAGPLAEKFKAIGVSLRDREGWGRVEHFGDPELEYKAAHKTVGLSDLSHLTKIRALGKDAPEYLHRRLSNSIKTLSPGDGCYATLLAGDGHLIADLAVLRSGESIWLLASPLLGETLANEIGKYIITEEAEVEDLTASHAVLGLIGPRAPDALQASGVAGDTPIPEKNKCVEFTLNDDKTGLVFWLGPPAGAEHLALLVPAESAASVFDRVHIVVKSSGGHLIGETTRETLRVEAGIPLFGREMDSTTIPLEVGLKNALDYNKGCYPGQEVIARITNLGHPAKQLVGLRLMGESPAADGAPLLFGDVECGKITTSVYSPAIHAPVALAVVNWPHREPGTRLRVADPASPREAIVIELPISGTH